MDRYALVMFNFFDFLHVFCVSLMRKKVSTHFIPFSDGVLPVERMFVLYAEPINVRRCFSNLQYIFASNKRIQKAEKNCLCVHAGV